MLKKKTHQQPDGELLKILQEYLLSPDVASGKTPEPSRDPNSLAEHLQQAYPKYKRLQRPALKLLIEKTLPFVPPVTRVTTPQPAQSPAAGANANDAIILPDGPVPVVPKNALNNSMVSMYKKSTSPEPLVNTIPIQDRFQKSFPFTISTRNAHKVAICRARRPHGRSRTASQRLRSTA